MARGLRSRLIVSAVAACAALAATVASPVVGPAADAAASTIVYTKQTVLVPTATLKSQLLSVSGDQTTYTFKSRSGVLAKLKAGSVMLLQQYAVRDVSKVAIVKKHLVVTTTPATLTDLIAKGTLAWNSGIDFGKGFVIGGSAVTKQSAIAKKTITNKAQPRVASLDQRFGLRPMAASGITLKGKVNGYGYSMTFTKKAKSVAVAVKITRESPIDLEISVTGTLNDLNSSGSMTVAKGKVTGAKALANHLAGTFTLAYEAKPISGFGLGTAGGIKIELPGEIAVPFMVGPVPMFVGVKVAFFASAGFSNFDQSLKGSYTLSYSGAGGFGLSSDGATTGGGVLKGLGSILLNAVNAVRKGPMSFVLGATMPQLELGLGVKGLNVAGNVTLIGNTEIASYGSSCDTRKMEVLGTTGVNAKFFGYSAGLGYAKLFDKTINAAWPKGCGVAP